MIFCAMCGDSPRMRMRPVGADMHVCPIYRRAETSPAPTVTSDSTYAPASPLGSLHLGLALFLSALLVLGCASTPDRGASTTSPEAARSYVADKPPQLRPFYEKVAREGRQNLVLNQMEAGLAAMELGEFGLAEESFDSALTGIETVYANNDQAKKARSLWYEEGMKDFKGEPYERAMAYYYRGLLYMMRGDFENARACFKSGVMQDAFAEEEQNRCDFALLIFLEGWASQCLGDRQMAAAAYREVKRLRPDFQPPGLQDNLLIIVETGTSPRKVADGVGHYELKYRRGRDFSEARVGLNSGRRSIKMYPIEDVFWQASTRGGRQVDKVLKGQVVFRQTNEQMGTVLTEVSQEAMIASPHFDDHEEDVRNAAAALGILGAAQMAIAVKVRPRADTRYWDNLPDAVHIATCRSDGDVQPTFTASFMDAAGRRLGQLDRRGRVYFARGGAYGLGWTRSRTALTASQ